MLNLETILHTLHVRFSTRESGSRVFYTVSCPFCSPSAKHKGASGAFTCSGNNLVYTCWRGCKHTQGAVGMLSEISGQPIRHVYKVLSENSDNTFYRKAIYTPSKALKSPENIGLDSIYASYLKARGFIPEELVKAYPIIFTPHSYYEYKNTKDILYLGNHIVFPVYNKYNELTSFTARNVIPNSPRRYTIPKREDEVVSIKTSGYNMNSENDILVITEGVFDALKGDFCACMGISYTTGFVDTVLEYWKQWRCKVCVMFDPEKQAQRQQRKLESALQLIIGDDLVKYKYPYEHDLGDCTKEEIQRIHNDLGIKRNLYYLDEEWKR